MKALTTILAEYVGILIEASVFGLVLSGIVLDQLGWR